MRSRSGGGRLGARAMRGPCRRLGRRDGPRGGRRRRRGGSAGLSRLLRLGRRLSGSRLRRRRRTTRARRLTRRRRWLEGRWRRCLGRLGRRLRHRLLRLPIDRWSRRRIVWLRVTRRRRRCVGRGRRLRTGRGHRPRGHRDARRWRRRDPVSHRAALRGRRRRAGGTLRRRSARAGDDLEQSHRLTPALRAAKRLRRSLELEAAVGTAISLHGLSVFRSPGVYSSRSARRCASRVYSSRSARGCVSRGA
jgi:hypothetical protein